MFKAVFTEGVDSRGFESLSASPRIQQLKRDTVTFLRLRRRRRAASTSSSNDLFLKDWPLCSSCDWLADPAACRPYSTPLCTKHSPSAAIWCVVMRPPRRRRRRRCSRCSRHCRTGPLNLLCLFYSAPTSSVSLTTFAPLPPSSSSCC